MDMFSIFECCGGRKFIVVPMIGLLEAKFTAAGTLFLSIVISLLWILRKHWIKIISLLTIICGVGMQIALSSSGHENGVKGWLQALDMAKVDTESDALRHWVAEHARKNDPQHQSNPLLPAFDLNKYREPQRIRVLSANESKLASQLLFEDKDSWIHMDRRTGPLPSFIYGTYYQYNSHNVPFPTPGQVKAAYAKFEDEGDPGAMVGPKATSTITYCDRHGVQYYNHKQRQLFKKLNLHERFRKAISKAIGMPVKYHPHWGLPGIHVTFSHKVMEYNIYQAHVDGSYSPITEEFTRNPKTQCVPYHRLSVTLTLQMPSDGAGLMMHIYNSTRQGCNDTMMNQANDYLDQLYTFTTTGQGKLPDHVEMDAALGRALSCLDQIKEEYVPGEAVIHSGAVIHSVAPWKFTSSSYDDARVTLQGFAFLCNGAWYLHW